MRISDWSSDVCSSDLKRGGIHAITQALRTRAIGKDMAQMAFTCRAAHFGSNHAMADIPVLLHRILFDRSGETGPAGARIELRVAGEKHRAAARAAVDRKSTRLNSSH